MSDERFFNADAPVFVARAPGRLDVMGGIADYSGSLVLELPLNRHTTATVQTQALPSIDILSLRNGVEYREQVSLHAVLTSTPKQLALMYARRRETHWASYVIGAVYACLVRHRQSATDTTRGVRIRIESDVPEGKGVSSSAAIEVSSLAAIAAAYDVALTPEEIASASQWAENHIAGAACGIMDQMTSACGRRDHLLRLRCQPATVEGHIAIPAGYRFYGIDSGIRHAITGADYGTVRTAAFMGYRMIAEMAGLGAERDGECVRVRDERWSGYLANISPEEFAVRFEQSLPELMPGAEFLARFDGITDTVTRVQPELSYPVRRATAHPVNENARVARVATLLGDVTHSPTAATELGRLMYESHLSYTACGLGSDGTDRLVQLVARAGPTRGLFGAKITGGGSGGTVVVFGTDASDDIVREIASLYHDETGRDAEVFTGSGRGLAEAGVFRTSGGATLIAEP